MLDHWKEDVENFLSLTPQQDEILSGMKVWVGRSHHEPAAIELGNAFEALISRLGAQITSKSVSCDTVHGEAVKSTIADADAVIMLASTPGVSAEALEFSRAGNGVINADEDKLRVLMPSDYQAGYIYKRLLSYQATVKTYPPGDPPSAAFAVTGLSELFTIKTLSGKRKQLKQDEYLPHIGIVTALSLEEASVLAILEKQRIQPLRVEGKGLREYTHGEIAARDGGVHAIVVAQSGVGNNAAAVTAANMINDFPSITDLIMVGIAAGVPDLNNATQDVRLGDVVVSSEFGVIQTDFVKNRPAQIEHIHRPRAPSATWLGRAQAHIRATKGHDPTLKYLADLIRSNDSPRPKANTDRLIDGDPKTGKAKRRPRDNSRLAGQPKVHIGAIGSANMLLRNAEDRDRYRKVFGISAVEMESSGLAQAAWQADKGFFIIRGICDYANDGKNKVWQPYAATAAAAFAKELIESMPLVARPTL